MNVEKTPLSGLLVVHPKLHPDARGFFLETYHEQRYMDAGVDARFVQDNHSSSLLGTLRGLHAQGRRPQAKLVRCIEGSIFDVAVDVREGSETFGQWFGVELSALNHRQLYVPVGFLHGFCVTSAQAQVEYKCSDVYVPDDQIGVRWDDPDIAIQWPLADPLLSDKDRDAPLLRDLSAQLPR
jgi:dTDP-4-dehydrorhamnose 3,5-epimerase